MDFYRFEGESNPDDMSILYAIEANDGISGTISSAYGTYADADTDRISEASRRLRQKPDEEAQIGVKIINLVKVMRIKSK